MKKSQKAILELYALYSRFFRQISGNLFLWFNYTFAGHFSFLPAQSQQSKSVAGSA